MWILHFGNIYSSQPDFERISMNWDQMHAMHCQLWHNRPGSHLIFVTSITIIGNSKFGHLNCWMQKQWPLEKVGTLLGLVIICSTSKSQDCKVCLICHSHLDGTYLESETDKSWRKSLGENDLMVGFDYCRVQNQVIYFHLCTFCNMARYSEINHLFLQDTIVFLQDKNVFLICTLWDVAIYSCFHCGISGWISYTLSQDYCCHRHGCRCHHINCCRCYHDQHQDTLRLFTL